MRHADLIANPLFICRVGEIKRIFNKPLPLNGIKQGFVIEACFWLADGTFTIDRLTDTEWASLMMADGSRLCRLHDLIDPPMTAFKWAIGLAGHAKGIRT
jgi:hypothetical protein